MTKKTIGVFIPGRLESERLPNKLILPIGNTCLWEIACKKLASLPKQYNKYVLVDEGNELHKIAQQFPEIKIIIRSPETCVRDGPLTYIFKDLQTIDDDYLMFLNPCLAFIERETLIRSLEDFKEGPYDCATSVKRYKNWQWNTKWQAITDIDYERLTTKEIDTVYEAAHAFHIFNVTQFFMFNRMLTDQIHCLLIDKEECIDVDDQADYEYARWKYENNSCRH